MKICQRCGTKLKWDKTYLDWFCPKCPKLLGANKTALSPEEFFKKINRPMESKIRESKKVILKYIKKTLCLWSGGKDSMLIAILAKQIDPNIPIIFCDTGLEFPETLKYLQTVRKLFKWKNFHVLKYKLGGWNMPREVVFGHVSSKKWKKIGCCTLLKVNLVKRWMKKHGYKREFVGLRWDEADNRWANLYIQGFTDKRFDIVRIFPLAWWNTDQIYEYYEKHNIPMNELYKKGYTRQGCYICPSCPEHTLKERHPNLFKIREQAKKRFPKLYNFKLADVPHQIYWQERAFAERNECTRNVGKNK